MSTKTRWKKKNEIGDEEIEGRGRKRNRNWLVLLINLYDCTEFDSSSIMCKPMSRRHHHLSPIQLVLDNDDDQLVGTLQPLSPQSIFIRYTFFFYISFFLMAFVAAMNRIQIWKRKFGTEIERIKIEFQDQKCKIDNYWHYHTSIYKIFINPIGWNKNKNTKWTNNCLCEAIARYTSIS